jgi:hypothetical protein
VRLENRGGDRGFVPIFTLVRMLHNERETAVKSGCRPIEPRSHFYDLDELRRCYDVA